MLKLTAVSVNHRTASVGEREKVFYSDKEISLVSEKIKKVTREALLLSTCNRTELYAVPAAQSLTHEDLFNLLLSGKNLNRDNVDLNYETYEGFEAVRHLFAVATGIDSLMVGDIQVLGQLKDAYNISVELGMAGTVLHHACQLALKAGKRAKSETRISEGAVSVSYAAVELAEKIFGSLKGRSAMLIGAGETAELAAKDLVPKEISKLFIANRTLERAENLIKQIGSGFAIPLESISSKLSQVDIIISSVASQEHILTRDMISTAMKGRENNPLLIIDIGVPRNVDPAVKKIGNVFLNDIDSLNMIVEKNLSMRKLEIPLVGRVIDEELNDFIKWYSSLDVGPTIKMLRDKIEQIRAEELKRYRGRLNESEIATVDEVTRALVNKILHEPLTNLKNSGNGIPVVDRVKMVKILFGLEEDEKG